MKLNKPFLRLGMAIAFLGIHSNILANLAITETRFCIEEKEGPFLYKLAYDFIYMQTCLLSVDTVKIGLIFTPWYFAARSADRPFQNCFYCSETHKNCCQMNKSCHTAADKGAIVISAGLALLSVAPFADEELQLTSRVFMAGLFPLWGLKNLFKRIKHEGCLRPKCEYFDKDKKYYGGCPSGHIAFMSYGTTLFGLQRGWKWGVPLGVATTAIFASSINSNRHYFSQIIAGAGLGLMYGVAANKVVNGYLGNTFECEVVPECNGATSLQLSWAY